MKLHTTLMALAIATLAACGGDSKDSETGADADTDTDTDSDTDTDTDTDTDSDTDTDTDTDSDTDTDTGSNDPAVFDLHFTGTGYETDAGHVMRFAVKDTTALDTVAVRGEVNPIPADGVIDITIVDAMTTGIVYALAWYSDVDDNGTCNEGDHVWLRAIGQVTADFDAVQNANGNFDRNACEVLNGP